MPSRTVYQFPVSHYCEKTRWNLDAKGLSYRVRDVLPGAHIPLARWLKVGPMVPILVDEGRAVGDSTEIALHLERTHGSPALLPVDLETRKRALDVEGFFNDRVGREVRRYVYGTLLKTTGSAARAFFGFYSAPAQFLGKIAGSWFEATVRKTYRIDEETLRASRSTIIDAIDRVEQLTDGRPDRYLVGDVFTLADLTAAALLAPILTPPGTPWETLTAQSEAPAELLELRDEVSTRPGGQWVLRRYREDRRRTLVS